MPKMDLTTDSSHSKIYKILLRKYNAATSIALLHQQYLTDVAIARSALDNKTSILNNIYT